MLSTQRYDRRFRLMLGANSICGNTAIGAYAMGWSTSGRSNTGVGVEALLFGGYFCTAIGVGALRNNNDLDEANPGQFNTAIGAAALRNNAGGDDNTAVGIEALMYTNNGSSNTAHGAYTLNNNTVGDDNTAVGDHSLFMNNGSRNTANGYRSLYENTTGNDNTAIGTYSMNANVSGRRVCSSIGERSAGVVNIVGRTTTKNRRATETNPIAPGTTGFKKRT